MRAFWIALAALPAAASEYDGIFSRALVVPQKIYEQKQKEYGECLTRNFMEERYATSTQLVVMNRELVLETQIRLAEYDSQHARGEKVDRVAEDNARRFLPRYEKSMNDAWVGYKNMGGKAETIEQVEKVKGPCGDPPQPPKY